MRSLLQTDVVYALVLFWDYNTLDNVARAFESCRTKCYKAWARGGGLVEWKSLSRFQTVDIVRLRFRHMGVLVKVYPNLTALYASRMVLNCSQPKLTHARLKYVDASQPQLTHLSSYGAPTVSCPKLKIARFRVHGEYTHVFPMLRSLCLLGATTKIFLPANIKVVTLNAHYLTHIHGVGVKSLRLNSMNHWAKTLHCPNLRSLTVTIRNKMVDLPKHVYLPKLRRLTYIHSGYQSLVSTQAIDLRRFTELRDVLIDSMVRLPKGRWHHRPPWMWTKIV